MTERRGLSWWILPIAAAVPALVSAILAAHGGWATTIDNAVIAVRARDAIGAHPPLVGIYTSLTVIGDSSTRLHHLGPLEFWLLALPLRLGAPSGIGLVFGASAINALAAGGSVWVAQRLAGLRLGALVTGGIALLAWSMGGQILHDPWNPHLAIFPFLFFLLAATAIAQGDLWLIPFGAFAGSLVLQLHLIYAVPVALTAIWAAVGLFLVRRTVEVSRRRLLWPLIITAVVLVACWIGPLLDQLFGSHNATGVARTSLRGGYAKVGLGVAWHDLVHATKLPPEWLDPFTGIIKNDAAPGWFAILTSLVVLGALVAVTVWAWARRVQSVAVLGTTALVACIGAFIASASSPAAYRDPSFLYPRRVWWVVGVLIWVALAHAALTFVAARWPGAWSRRSLPAIAFGVGAVALALALVWPRLGPAQDYGSGGFGPVRELGAAAAHALHGPGPWELRTVGNFADGVVGSGVASELILRDRPVLVPDANFPDFGKEHFGHPGERVASRVLVVSGPEAGQPMPGYSLVARWDPATAPEPYRSYRQTLFVVPIDPVAVYVSTTPYTPHA